MKQRKNFVRGVRLTEKTDVLIDAICETCNRHACKMNGDSSISGSALLTFFFEKVAHAPVSERELMLSDLLIRYYGMHDERGELLSREKASEIAREVFSDGS